MTLAISLELDAALQKKPEFVEGLKKAEAAKEAAEFGEMMETNLLANPRFEAPVYIADQRLTLVAVRALRTAADQHPIYLNGAVPHTGYTIIGPTERWEADRDDKTLYGQLRAYRWAQFPVRHGQGVQSSEIWGDPSIVSDHRYRLTCKVCGFGWTESKRSLMRYARTADGKAVHRWPTDQAGLEALSVGCQSRRGYACTGKASLMRLNPKIDRCEQQTDDPVLAQEAERREVLSQLGECFRNQPSDASLMTPQIWVVYRAGQCPNQDWKPEDAQGERAMEAAQRMTNNRGEADPCTVLPYHIAAPYHRRRNPISTATRRYWLDIPATGMVGWIRRADLNQEGPFGINLAPQPRY